MIRFESSFLVKDTVCVNTPILFSGSSLICDTCGIINKWEWDFGDGVTDTNQNTQHKFINERLYNVKLAIRSAKGYQDSVSRTIRVAGKPKANFQVSDSIICNDNYSYIYFFDSSTVCYGGLKYYWDYGDGYSDSFGHYHHYSKSGTYHVKLVVRSTIDSSADSMEKTIVVKTKPKAVASYKTNVCISSSIQFTDSLPADSYLWTFGDGDSSTLQNPVHTYKKIGVYAPTLTVKNNNGCFDNNQYLNRIAIDDFPHADFSIPTDGCAGSPITIEDYSKTDYQALYSWYFGDGTSLQNVYRYQTPTHTYLKGGSYQMKLVTVSRGGCSDSVIHSISIHQPIIDWKISDIGNRTFDFSTTPNPQYTYYWSFGDGLHSTNSSTKHSYFNANWIYKIKLTVTELGCTASLDTYLNVISTSINPTLNSIKSIIIFPNPFSSSLNIELNLSSSQQTRIELCGLDGRPVKEIYNGILKEGKNELQVSCPLASGVYMLRLVTRDGVMNSRIIKME